MDENNLQKVNHFDISKGATIQFMRGEIMLNGVVKDTRVTGKPKELVYDVEYACSTVVGMKAIVKVTGRGVGA